MSNPSSMPDLVPKPKTKGITFRCDAALVDKYISIREEARDCDIDQSTTKSSNWFLERLIEKFQEKLETHRRDKTETDET